MSTRGLGDISVPYEDGVNKYATGPRTSCLVRLLVTLLLLCAGVPLLWPPLDRMARRNRMAQEIARINSGETSDLCNPDPEFVDLVMSDPERVKKVRGLVFLTELTTCDVSDPRLGRLAHLPNLTRVVLNDTVGTDAFLKHLRKSESLTTFAFSRSELHGEGLTTKSVEYLSEIPNLKHLEIWFGFSDRIDLTPLSNHEDIETVDFAYRPGDLPCGSVPTGHLEVLKSLPNLRSLSLAGCVITDEAVETLEGMTTLEELDISASSASSVQLEELRRALPNTGFLSPGETRRRQRSS